MSSNVVVRADESNKTPEQQQNVVQRVTNLPLVSSACDVVNAVYSSTKDSHPYICSVINAAEKGAKTLTEVTITGSKPFLSRLEPQIAAANELACKGLDKLECSLPILQMPTEKVVLETKVMMTGACDTVTGAVSDLMGLATGAVQVGMDVTKSVVSTVVDSHVGQFVTGSLDTVLGKSEEWIDHYLPMTDEELSQLASTVDGFEVAPLQQQKEQQSYYVRLGSLSSLLRHRAYQHSLGKVRNAQISTMETLAQLHQMIDLMDAVKQSVHGGQEKLHQFWHKQCEAGSEQNKECEALDSRVLMMTRALTKQLQTTCFTLVATAQGLPTNIQECMQQLRLSAQNLHSSFSTAHSLGDVSAGILAQSREQVNKVHDYVNDLVTYIAANTPLTWLVGPFAPQLIERPETPEEHDQNTI